MQLGGDDQVEGAQRGLVQRGEHRADHHQRQRGRLLDHQGLVPAQTLEDHAGELQRQHRGVEHHAPADLEHHGARVPHHQRVPDVPGPAQVEQQRHHDQRVAEEGGQDGGPHDRLEPLEVEDVDHRGDHEAAGRQADAAEQVEADPEAPGEGVGEVGDRAQPLVTRRKRTHRAGGQRWPGTAPPEAQPARARVGQAPLGELRQGVSACHGCSPCGPRRRPPRGGG